MNFMNIHIFQRCTKWTSNIPTGPNIRIIPSPNGSPSSSHYLFVISYPTVASPTHVPFPRNWPSEVLASGAFKEKLVPRRCEFRWPAGDFFSVRRGANRPVDTGDFEGGSLISRDGCKTRAADAYCNRALSDEVRSSRGYILAMAALVLSVHH